MEEQNKKLEDFKVDIRAALIPSKDGERLQDINSCYKEFTGKNIPYRELGFGTLKELLYRVPDAVKLVSRGSEVFGHAVYNAATAHIGILVSKQKPKSKAARNRPKRYTNLNRSKTSGRDITTNVTNHSVNNNLMKFKISPQIKQNIQNLLSLCPSGLPVVLLENAYKNFYGNILNYFAFRYDTVYDFVKALHCEKVLHLSECGNDSVLYYVKPSNCVQQRCIPVPIGIPLAAHQPDVKIQPHSNVQKTISSKADIKPTTIKESKIFPTKEQVQSEEIPEDIQENVYNLLKCSSSGFLLSQFEQEYEDYFDEQFPWKYFHFKSLDSALKTLKFKPPIMFIHLESGDQKIMLEPNLTNTNPSLPATVPLQPRIVASIPDDVVTQEYTYMPFKVPFELNEYFPAVVSAVENPGKIWLQAVSRFECQNKELKNLMDTMEKFYQSEIADSYQVPKLSLCKNLVCVVPFPTRQEWRRGCIVDIPTPDTVRILCFDYGNVCEMSADLVRYLKRSFATLAAQAFPARLAEVQPISSVYSDESCMRLCYLCYNKILMAKITNKKYMNTFSVILQDTSGVILNDVIIKQGLVQSCSDLVELRKPRQVTILHNEPTLHESPIVENEIKKGLVQACNEQRKPRQVAISHNEPMLHENSIVEDEIRKGLVQACNDLVERRKPSQEAIPHSELMLRETSGAEGAILNDVEIKKELFRACNDLVEQRKPSQEAIAHSELMLRETSGAEGAILNDVGINKKLFRACNDLVEIRKPSPETVSHNEPNFISHSNLGIPDNFTTLTSKTSSYRDTPSPLFSKSLSCQSSSCGSTTELNPYAASTSSTTSSIVNPVIMNRLKNRAIAKMKSQKSEMKRRHVSPSVETSPESMCENLKRNTTTSLLSPSFLSPNSLGYSSQNEDEIYESSSESDCENVSRFSVSSSASSIANLPERQRRFCRKVNFRNEEHVAHLVNYLGQPCFTIADVSSFIFSVDVVKRFLQIQQCLTCSITVSRDKHPALFKELERSAAAGFTADNSKPKEIDLYILSDVVKILTFLSQNSQSLIKEIKALRDAFNPEDVYWKTPDSSPVKGVVENSTFLKAKLLNAQMERKSILQYMLKEEYSSPEAIKWLMYLNEKIPKLKIQLLRVGDVPEV